MTLLDLVVYCLTAFGFWWIVGRSRVSLGLRTAIAARGASGELIAELLECPGCFGFWFGVAASFGVASIGACIGSVFDNCDSFRGLCLAIVFGCFTAASNLLLFSLVGPGLDRLEGPPRP
jgi:hypothetical protein